MLEAKCEQLLSAKPSCMLSLVVVVYAKKNSEVGDSVRLFSRTGARVRHALRFSLIVRARYTVEVQPASQQLKKLTIHLTRQAFISNKGLLFDWLSKRHSFRIQLEKKYVEF